IGQLPYGHPVPLGPEHLDGAACRDELAFADDVDTVAVEASDTGRPEVGESNADGSSEADVVRCGRDGEGAAWRREARREPERRSHPAVGKHPQQQSEEDASEQRAVAQDGQALLFEDAHHADDDSGKAKNARHAEPWQYEDLDREEHHPHYQQQDVERTRWSGDERGGRERREGDDPDGARDAEAWTEDLDEPPTDADDEQRCRHERLGEEAAKALGEARSEE